MLQDRRWTSVGVVLGLVSGVLVVAAALAAGRRITSDPHPVTRQDGMRGQRVNAAGTAAITIAKPMPEVFSFVRDVRNWPQVMTGLQAVEPLGGDRWRLKFGNGALTTDVKVSTLPGEGNVIWTTGEGARVQTRGGIFMQDAEAGRGTEVIVKAAWRPPGGTIGQPFTSVFSEKRVCREVARLKTLLERGRVDTASRRLPHF